MNSALALLPGLADRLHHLLGAVLMPLAVLLPTVVLFGVLFGLLFAARTQPPNAAAEAQPQSGSLPAADAAPSAGPAVRPETPAALAALAVRKAQSESGPAPAEAAPAAVLIADDSAVVRAKLVKLFRGAGYDAVAARDGVEALDLLAQRHFDVLVTDLEMPNMNGFELIAAVQGSLETEDLPIVAITGHEALQARVHEFGGLYGIFRKPWNDRELLRRVQSLAGVRRQPLAA